MRDSCVAVSNVGEVAGDFLNMEEGPMKSYLLAGFNVNLAVLDHDSLFSLEYPAFVQQAAEQIWEHSSFKLAVSISKCFILEDSQVEQFIDLLNPHGTYYTRPAVVKVASREGSFEAEGSQIPQC